MGQLAPRVPIPATPQVQPHRMPSRDAPESAADRAVSTIRAAVAPETVLTLRRGGLTTRHHAGPRVRLVESL